MTDRKSLIAEYKDLKNRIRATELLLQGLKDRRNAITDMFSSSLTRTFEEYLRDLLTRLMDYSGQEDVGLWFNMDTVIEDIVISSHYEYVNDYYGDCELIEYVSYLYLDKSSGQVMVSINTRYSGTNIDDDVKEVPFSDIAQVELDSGKLLITTLMRLLEEKDIDYSLWDDLELRNYHSVQPNPYFLAVSSLGPREFSLGALSTDCRYDEIGNLSFKTGVVRIADAEYEGCDEVEVIHIPEGVTHIGTGSFRGCSRVQYIDLPDSLVEIGEHAFEGCECLEKVIFPKSLKSIGRYAFKGCSRLKCINLPDSIDSVGQNAFEGVSPLYISYGRIRIEAAELGLTEKTTLIDRTSDLTSIDLPFSWLGEEDVRFYAPPEGIVRLDLGEFHLLLSGGPLNPFELWIPDSIEEISSMYGGFLGFVSRISVSPHNQTFDSRGNCNAVFEKEHNNLVCGCISTVIPDGVERICERAFQGCWASKIVVPNGVSKIDEEAFWECFNLKEVILPTSLKSIGRVAFECCESLTSLFIPDSVTEVGDNLCECCYSLDNVSVPFGLDVADTFLDCAEEFTRRDPK